MDDDINAATVFVKIDSYKGVANMLELIRNKLIDAKENLEKVNQMKITLDAELKGWEDALGKVESKVEEINNTLFRQPIN